MQVTPALMPDGQPEKLLRSKYTEDVKLSAADWIKAAFTDAVDYEGSGHPNPTWDFSTEIMELESRLEDANQRLLRYKAAFKCYTKMLGKEPIFNIYNPDCMVHSSHDPDGFRHTNPSSSMGRGRVKNQAFISATVFGKLRR